MAEFFRQLLRGFAARLFAESRAASLDLMKIKAVAIYLKIVDSVRRSVLFGFMLVLALLVLVVGFVALHIGVFIIFDMSLRTIGIITLCLGVVYFFVPLIVILRLTSERKWMEMSKSSGLVNDVLSTRHKD